MSIALTIALQSDKRATEYARQARAVEAHGFDGLSVYSDLGFQPPMAPLMVAADVTERLRLGPSCLNPYLLHPVEIAGQIAALDEACGGRAYLGLARGAWLEQVGVRQRAPLAHLQDTIEIVRRLLARDTQGYRGTVFSLDPGFQLHYTPVRPEVDVLLGVWGPRGAALAGRFADEVKIGGCANPDMVRQMRQWLDESSQAAGREPGAVGVCAGAVTVVDDDGDVARGLARREVAMYVDVVAGLDPTVHVEDELLTRLRLLLEQDRPDEAGALLSDDLLDRFAFAGTPAQLVEHTVRLAEAGADRIEFGTPHGVTGTGGIALLGSQVVPAVRAALGAPATSAGTAR